MAKALDRSLLLASQSRNRNRSWNRSDRFLAVVLLLGTVKVGSSDATFLGWVRQAREVRIEIGQTLTQLWCRQPRDPDSRRMVPNLGRLRIKPIVNESCDRFRVRAGALFRLSFRHGSVDESRQFQEARIPRQWLRIVVSHPFSLGTVTGGALRLIDLFPTLH